MKGKGLFLVIMTMVVVWSMTGIVAHAADETRKDAVTTSIEEIHVVATPIIEGNILDRYAGQKTTVTQDQIDNLNALDMGTALRKTPGVNISRYNPVGSFGGGNGGAVFIRGMGSSRPGAEIKTFIDGVPMYMSVWNHPLLDLLAIDPAGSIDVYKSPQPQHFGNAIGAINIVPKQMTSAGYQSKVKLAAGNYKTWVGVAETAGKTDRLDYYVGGGYRMSDGHRDNGDGKTSNIFTRFGYQLSQHWDASFFGLYSNNYADDPGAEGADPATREGTYETRSTLASLNLSHTYDHLEGNIKVYLNSGEGDWLDQPTGTVGVLEDLYNDFKYYGLKMHETAFFGNGGEVTGGLDWEYTEGDYKLYYTNGTSDHWDGHDFTLFSPYAALSQRIGDENGLYAIPSVGVRFYHHSDFDEEWSPHAGLIVGYGSFKGHLGYSRGVVYPGLDVVVLSEEIITMLGDSWENLDAETMDHYEAGVTYAFGRIATADVTLFYNDGKNRYVIVPPPPPPPIYDNIEEYVTKGVEASVEVCPVADLSLFLSATFINTDPSDLPYAPDKTFSAGVNWRFLPAWTLNLDAQYVDDMTVSSMARRLGDQNTQTVDDYFILNGKLSYAFTLKEGAVSGEVFAAGENLTDVDYEYLPGYPMPGINGMAGVTLSF